MKTSGDYLRELHKISGDIIDRSSKENDFFAECTLFSERIVHLKKIIKDNDECNHIDFVSNQIQMSGFLLSMGLYRQAFSALRLALELGIACIYFSLNKIEHLEWMAGSKDIVWARLIDSETGVLSGRFSNAFSCNSENMEVLNKTARSVYRQLSEYVHGNKQTFDSSLLHITFNADMVEAFRISIQKVIEVLTTLFFIRYHKNIQNTQKDDISTSFEDVFHKEYIRSFFGGPKGF